jgi:hypothetical protein
MIRRLNELLVQSETVRSMDATAGRLRRTDIGFHQRVALIEINAQIGMCGLTFKLTGRRRLLRTDEEEEPSRAG